MHNYIKNSFSKNYFDLIKYILLVSKIKMYMYLWVFDKLTFIIKNP